MADVPSKKARKTYLHHSKELGVPKTTFYRRWKEGEENADCSSAPSSAEPSTCGDDASPSCTGDDLSREPSPVGSEESCMFREEAEDCDDSVESGSPPPLIEEEILANTFAALSSETLPNLGTSKAGAAAMAMSYAVTHGLTWTALGNLAALVNSIAGADVLPRNKYAFRKLWSTKKSGLVTYWYLCDVCQAVLTVENGNALCTVCGTKENVTNVHAKGSFFVTLDTASQLCLLIDRTKESLEEGLLKRSQRCDAVTDITSAACFHELSNAENLTYDDLTLTINTDGSPVFKSSKTSVWPLQIVVNELPPAKRLQNPVLTALWFGRTHPNMQTFLAKFVEQVKSMKPISWKTASSVHQSRVFVLCCAVDAPARAAVLNMIQFNGLHGCPRCLTMATHREGGMRYIDQPAEERTHSQVIRDMHIAYITENTVNGFKGPSALMSLKGFNLVKGVSVEYMHCVLLGVTRQISEALFSTTNCSERYYVGSPSSVREVNNRLLSIQPPHCITRLPRRIDDRAHWKASEWKHWLLFYALPCLDGLIPHEYWRHLVKLSEAVHILLREEISTQQIDHAGHVVLRMPQSRSLHNSDCVSTNIETQVQSSHNTWHANTAAERLLSMFAARCEALYGVTAATFNVHQLYHLAESVRHLGPLWAHSAFSFESGNGHLVKSVTAAHGLPHQIVERVVMGQYLEHFIATANISEEDRAVCDSFLGHPHIKNAVEEGGATFLGLNKHATLSASEMQALNNTGYGGSSIECYERLVFKKQMYHSTLYKRPTKSDSTFVQTSEGFFRIEKMVRVLLRAGHTCLLLCREVLFLDDQRFPQHIRPCFLSAKAPPKVLRPSDILKSCVYLEFSNTRKAFLCPMPNMIERD
ncbi:uncharacterized protein [Dermacentor albipictus]